MNNAVQIIVTPSGERLTVLPEEDYLLLLAASEDDEGEPKPGISRGVAPTPLDDRRSRRDCRVGRFARVEGLRNVRLRAAGGNSAIPPASNSRSS